MMDEESMGEQDNPEASSAHNETHEPHSSSSDTFFRFQLHETGTAKNPSRGWPAGAAPSGRP